MSTSINININMNMYTMLIYIRIFLLFIRECIVSLFMTFGTLKSFTEVPRIIRRHRGLDQNQNEKNEFLVLPFTPFPLAIDGLSQTVLVELIYTLLPNLCPWSWPLSFVLSNTQSKSKSKSKSKPHTTKYFIHAKSNVSVDFIYPTSRKGNTIMLFVLGVGGTTDNASYLVPWLSKCEQKGWLCAVVNRRTDVVSTHADVEDIVPVLEFIKESFPDPEWTRIGVGYSAGGNHLVKSLKTQTKQSQFLHAVVTVSTNHYLPNTCSYLESDAFMNELFGISQKHMAARLLHDLYPDSRKLRKLTEIDAVVAKHYGHAGLREYYKDMSSIEELELIDVPTLVIVSKDDGLVNGMPEFLESITQKNENVTGIVTDRGGHVAWIDNRLRPWVVDVIVGFLEGLRPIG